MSPQSKEDTILSELLWQQKLLEKDKEIHEKEKQLQAAQKDFNLLKLEDQRNEEKNRQMM